MIYVRQSMWETNSSTMNQIIISPEHARYYYGPNEVILHTKLPYTEGDIVNSAAEKINIIWCLLLEIECNWRYQTDEDWDDEECPYIYSHESYSSEILEKLSKNLPQMKEMFNNVITKRDIQLYRETTEMWNDCLDHFGLQGFTGSFLELFESEDTLDRFIFNHQSFFIFGVEGYYENTFGDYDIKLKEGFISIMI